MSLKISLQEISDYASDIHALRNLEYDGKPYKFHLEMVVEFAKRFLHEIPAYLHDEVLAACWCHDILEDTASTYNDLLEKTGSKTVAEIVYHVTNEKGRDRKERAMKTYIEIVKEPLAVFVKCCDRMANTTHSHNSGSSMYKKYLKEYESFRYHLKGTLYPELWKALDILNQYKEKIKE